MTLLCGIHDVDLMMTSVQPKWIGEQRMTELNNFDLSLIAELETETNWMVRV